MNQNIQATKLADRHIDHAQASFARFDILVARYSFSASSSDLLYHRIGHTTIKPSAVQGYPGIMHHNASSPCSQERYIGFAQAAPATSGNSNLSIKANSHRYFLLMYTYWCYYRI